MALFFLSAMLAEDPTEDKFSVLPQRELDGLVWIFDGARDEWRLENISVDSEWTKERVDSEVTGEGHG